MELGDKSDTEKQEEERARTCLCFLLEHRQTGCHL